MGAYHVVAEVDILHLAADIPVGIGVLLMVGVVLDVKVHVDQFPFKIDFRLKIGLATANFCILD